MGDILASLEKEYCPPVDPALLSAILSDYDLTESGALASAREILDSIRSSATEEEATAFDPSGAHFADVEDNATSEHGAFSVAKSDTDATSLSNEFRSLGLDNRSELELDHVKNRDDFLEDVEQMDVATKMILLQEMFPKTNDYTVAHTLKKCNGNWNRAMEELLNQVFFFGDELIDGDHKVAVKGIDAFSEDNASRRGRKKRDRRKIRSVEDESRSSSLPGPDEASSHSLWETAQKDVEFISSRAKVPTSAVSSLYHKNGASVSATILALLETTSIIAGTKTSPSDPIIVVNANELASDFPLISPNHLIPLVRLTHPSIVAAHELAQALVSRRNGKRGGIEVIPHYSPINLVSDEEKWTSHSSRSPSRSAFHTPVNVHDPLTLAHLYGLGQQRAFDQASSAYRRGKSDHLMAAAAGYYSQLGRDYAAKRVEATAEVADELVASQSSSAQIDLHGVSVKDAVRIARQKTEFWWRHGGGRGVMGLDGRVDASRVSGQGLRIVTGVGRHSEGGRAKIGPAVGRMLASEGWKVVMGEGAFTVTGKIG